MSSIRPMFMSAGRAGHGTERTIRQGEPDS